MKSILCLALLGEASASLLDFDIRSPALNSLIARQSTSAANLTGCSLDQSKPPGNLTLCGNQTLFQVFRPKARFIAPEGWMNDPMGMFQRADGTFHAGYQSHPQHIQWGNISMGAAHSKDMTFWTDFGSSKSYKTIWPSEVYDIRGVFDGSIIKDGWNGNPTIIYTSTFTSPLGQGVVPPEIPGSETQSLAYTADGGNSWTKLRFGNGGNPVIYNWPTGFANLTGFRDPYAFLSPRFTSLLANTTSVTNATGDVFLTISGGVRGDADPNGGGRLYLYRQTKKNVFTDWTFLGPLIGTGINESFSDWSGNFGKNYETASVTRLNPTGAADDTGSDRDAVDVVGFGTEQGRNGTHENHWPLWSAVDLTVRANGSINGEIKYSGVADWGRSYAFVSFPVNKGRQVSIGWTYEDDENLVLATQQGYQGAFSLFRDLFVKITKNVDPATPGLNDRASWGVRNESDGSTSVITIGQKVIPETLTAYKSGSKVSTPAARKLQGVAGTTKYTPFETQPKGKFYAIAGQFNFGGDNGTLMSGGFRVRASDSEWTDILYNPNTEELTINRTASTLITSYGNDTELAKLKLFNIKSGSKSAREPLNLQVFVDNSVLEVYANDVAVITTKIYPWLSKSIGAGFLNTAGGNSSSLSVKNVELWDGLINAWPNRPADTRQGLVWDGAGSALFGLWAGI